MDIEKPIIDKEKSESLGDKPKSKPKEKEFGGFEARPEPTRFGDWEVNGRCSDF